MGFAETAAAVGHDLAPRAGARNGLFPENSYMRIKVTRITETEKTHSLVLEGEILEVLEGDETQEGKTGAYILKPSNVMAYSNAIYMLGAIAGAQPEEVMDLAETKEVGIELINMAKDSPQWLAAQPGKGEVMLRRRATTLKNGQPFQTHDFSPVK